MIKAKTFIQAIEGIDADYKKTLAYFKDKRLTQVEKEILKCAYLIRDNKCDEAIKTLLSLRSDDQLVEALRHYYLGFAYNHACNGLTAISHLVLALGLSEPYPVNACRFKMAKSLFYSYLNSKHTRGMKHALHTMQGLVGTSSQQKLALELAQFSFLCVTDETEDLAPAIKRLEKSKDLMNEGQIICFYIDCFDAHIKRDEFTKAKEVIEAIKKHRKFLISANFKFMQSLLQHLTDDKPLYLYDKDFVGFPNLYHQIKVILHLESKEPELALKHWKQLQSTSADTYKDNFNYEGDKCLFSLCLKKNLKPKLVLDELCVGKSKEEQLFSLLTKANAPIKKEVIYQLIYGTEVETKADLAKLSHLVSRAKQNNKNIDILYKKGCYELRKVS